MEFLTGTESRLEPLRGIALSQGLAFLEQNALAGVDALVTLDVTNTVGYPQK